MKNTGVRFITQTALLLALGVVFQSLRLVPILASNPVVSSVIIGILINTVLIIAADRVGWSGGIIIGALFPVIAFMQQFLPNPMMIVIVAVGNIVLVAAYAQLQRYNRIVALIVAAFIKFVFLYYAVRLTFTYLFSIPEAMFNTLSASFGYMQLLTAIAGGILALLISDRINKAQQ